MAMIGKVLRMCHREKKSARITANGTKFFKDDALN
jgi:hypothetical protein